MSYETLMTKLTRGMARHTPKSWHDALSLLKAYLFRGYGQLFYSQDGIDALLKSRIGADRKIFYVDVGANHPFFVSNTYAFYRNGSRGINIDAYPGSMSLFKLARRRDINLEIPISNNDKEHKKFYVFDTPALNSFDEKLSKERAKTNKLKKIILLKPQRLSAVLDSHLPKRTEIDLLSVDTEGHDLEVLSSNDWKRYRHSFIIVEDFAKQLGDVEKSAISAYLKIVGYKVAAFSGINTLYEKVK